MCTQVPVWLDSLKETLINGLPTGDKESFVAEYEKAVQGVDGGKMEDVKLGFLWRVHIDPQSGTATDVAEAAFLDAARMEVLAASEATDMTAWEASKVAREAHYKWMAAKLLELLREAQKAAVTATKA